MMKIFHGLVEKTRLGCFAAKDVLASPVLRFVSGVRKVVSLSFEHEKTHKLLNQLV